MFSFVLHVVCILTQIISCFFIWQWEKGRFDEETGIREWDDFQISLTESCAPAHVSVHIVSNQDFRLHFAQVNLIKILGVILHRSI